jgi:hypothetical protein
MGKCGRSVRTVWLTLASRITGPVSSEMPKRRQSRIPHFLCYAPAVIGIRRTVDDAGFIARFPQRAGKTEQHQGRSQNPAGIRRQEQNHLARTGHHGQYGVAYLAA